MLVPETSAVPLPPRWLLWDNIAAATTYPPCPCLQGAVGEELYFCLDFSGEMGA